MHPRGAAVARPRRSHYLSRLGGESVPNWDLDAPTQHKDSSSAAAVASALIELSGFVDMPDSQLLACAPLLLQRRKPITPRAAPR